jgi:hypothetical protein
MISGKIYHLSKHAARINELLAGVRGEGSGRLADAIERTLKEGNRDDRLRGVDRLGRALAPRKHPRPDGANGPALAPHGAASRSVTTYFARVTRKRDGWSLAAGFDGPFWLALHAQGRGRYGPVAVRDLLGTAPMVLNRVKALFRDWAAGLFQQTGYRG